jgi:parallel beta-helix repeat protein
LEKEVELFREPASIMLLFFLLVSPLILASNVQPVKSDYAWTETIYILANGSIQPSTAPISSVDNVTYTLTDNIVGNVAADSMAIFIQRDNIIINGADHALQGNGSGTGVDLLLRSNVTIENMQIKEFYDGVILDDSSGDSISSNNITANNDDGIHVTGPSLVGNTIIGNNITENDRFGIYLADCNGNNVSENSIIANHVNGVYLDYSVDSILTENVIGNNGISFWSSSRNVLRSNNITAGTEAFSVNGIGYSDFVNDIDVSNTVNGKPIYYMVGEHERNIPIDAGYVALVLCSNITVQNLNLTNNGQGVLLVNTTDSRITQNNITNISLLSSNSNIISGNRITNSSSGIQLDSSNGNSIFGNNITTSNGVGIVLEASSNSNNVTGNSITNNVMGIRALQCESNVISSNSITANKADGIYLWSCFDNIIFANEIANNDYGFNIDYYMLDAASSSGNKIYHNNLVNNTNQVSSFYYSTNIWDDGYPSGGNYWTDYNGTDGNRDGIGDTPYVIDANNTDRYPLMAPYDMFDVGIWNGTACSVGVMSNSTVSAFQVDVAQKTIGFNVAGAEASTGFCRVIISNSIVQNLWQGNYTVLVDGKPWPFTNWTDTTNTYLYFNYTHSTDEITISPEFSSFLILLLFMIATLPAVRIYKKKGVKTSQSLDRT